MHKSCVQASSKTEDLGEFGVALLHVIKFGYKTSHRCRVENTKRFRLASCIRSPFQKFSN